MKKILLVATVLAFVGSGYTYAGDGGGKDKKKAGKECTKTAEKKSCCASKSSCKKPADAAASENKPK